MDKGGLSEEEKRRRDRRRRERDTKEGRSRGTRTKGPRGFDIIDKLDVTGIYGLGQFHHDGPFDACNPHRNRRKDHRAPMQAFPKDSANNALGGSGPINKHIDLEQFHGRGSEGFTDYATSGAADSVKVRGGQGVYNPKGTLEPVHGEASVGLGTSTFLEGTPASRTDLQRRDSEVDANATSQQSNLQRKKSLAQRFRGISQPRRPFGDGPMTTGGRIITSPPGYRGTGDDAQRAGSLSAGGRTRMNEHNPFFEDYDDAYDRKGASIIKASTTPSGEPERPQTSGGRFRAPSSPRRPSNLERKLTADGAAAEDTKGGSGGGAGGLLNRMKSLKGGKRVKPQPLPQPQS